MGWIDITPEPDEIHRTYAIKLPTDHEGYLGRECPECNYYFKLRLSTFPETLTHLYCPYCGNQSIDNEFTTKSQLEYAQNLAINQFLNEEIQPLFDKLNRSFRRLERNTRGGLLSFKVDGKFEVPQFSDSIFQELELQTSVKCSFCKCEFTIYGIFAYCPNCGSNNALSHLCESIQFIKQLISFKSKIGHEGISPEIIERHFLSTGLIKGISAFEAYGKFLQRNYPLVFSSTRNLFQKLATLSSEIQNKKEKSIEDLIGSSEYQFLSKMFQVRHIYEHNNGVIDQSFIDKVPSYSSKLGQIFELKEQEIIKTLDLIVKISTEILKLIDTQKM